MNFKPSNRTEKRNIGQFDLDYTILKASEALPSKGKFYPEPYVYVRGLRFREQLEAEQIKKLDDNALAHKFVYRLHRQCIDIPEIEPDDILTEDMTVLSMWVTFLTSPSTKFNLKTKCPHCKKDNVYNIITSELNLEDFKSFEPAVVETELGTLLIAPETIKDNEELELIENLPTAMKHASMIKKLNGEPITADKKVEVLGLLKKEEAVKVIQECKKFTSDITPLDKECLSCKGTYQVYPYIDIVRGLP